MELIRGLHNLRSRHHGCVATIGNFDGVHLGHQAVLGQVAETGAELGLPTVVITFEPQPQEYFARSAIPPRLTRLREKLRVLLRFSVDRVLMLRFDKRLAAMSAQRAGCPLSRQARTFSSRTSSSCIFLSPLLACFSVRAIRFSTVS